MTVQFSPLLVIGLVVTAFGIGCSSAGKHQAAPNGATQTNSTQVAQPPASTTAAPTNTAVPTTAATSESGESLKCVRDKDSRALEIESVKPAGCKLFYTKDARRSSVASSPNGNGHCERVLGRMQKNLEGAGFKCAK